MTHWAGTALGLLVIYGPNAWLVELMLGAGHGSAASLHCSPSSTSARCSGHRSPD